MKRFFFLCATAFLLYPDDRALSAQWVQTNGPVGGHVLSVAIWEPYLFTSVWSGFYRSPDGGASWTRLDMGLDNVDVTCLAVFDSVLYAGTNNGLVFHTSDHGSSWTALDLVPANVTILSIAITGTHIYLGAGGGGILRSLDNGSTWAATNTGLTDSYIHSLLVSGSEILAGTLYGMFRSMDNGATWTASNEGLPPFDFRTRQDSKSKPT